MVYPKSESALRNFIKDITQNEYSVVEAINYKNSKSRIKLRHNICKETFDVILKDFYKNFKDHHGGCPACANKKREKHLSKHQSIDDFRAKMKMLDPNNEYELLSMEYIDNKHKLLFKHKKCGKEFWMRPNDFQQGYRCPDCSKKMSSEEVSLLKYLDSIYNDRIIHNDRSLINPYELDIVFPKLKLAIEYNGLYWHSQLFKERDYHYNKAVLCSKNGYRLIQIFEDEWTEHPEVIKQYLYNIIKFHNTNNYLCRTGTIVDLNNFKVNFPYKLDKHIMGIFVKYNNDKIIAIMTTNSKHEITNYLSYTNDDSDLFKFALYKIYIDAIILDNRYFQIKDQYFGYTHTDDIKPRFFYTDYCCRDASYHKNWGTIADAGYTRYSLKKD